MVTKLTKNKSLAPSKKAGFTVIEITVTIGIFSVVAFLIVSIFVRAIAIERRTVSAQRIQENATFIIESMSKEIRVSGIVNQDSLNCATTTLTLNHPVEGIVTYSLQNGNIHRQAAFGSFMNSSDVVLNWLRFCITGSTIDDNESPRVTILVSLSSVKGEILTVELQTTVVSRDINSELQN